MFKALFKLTEHVNVNLSLSKSETGVYTVIVLPKPKNKDDESYKVPPFVMKGTLGELEANADDLISKAFIDTGFTNNLDAFSDNIKSKIAKKGKTEEKTEVQKDIAKDTKTTKPAEKKAEFKPDAKQKKAIENAKVLLTKAKSATDSMMVSFLTKEAIKTVTDAKLPIDQIETVQADFAKELLRFEKSTGEKKTEVKPEIQEEKPVKEEEIADITSSENITVETNDEDDNEEPDDDVITITEDPDAEEEVGEDDIF